MRFLKKSTSIILALSMLLVCSVNVFASDSADAASPITIGSVGYDNSAVTGCVEFTANYTVTGATPKNITVLFSSEAIDSVNFDSTDILYIDQKDYATNSTSCNFLVTKTRLTSGSTYYFYMGGTDIDTAANFEKSYSEGGGVIPPVPTGVALTGTVITWNDESNAKVYLYSSEETDANIKADMVKDTPELATKVGTANTEAAVQDTENTNKYGQAFSFADVTPGTYKLAIFKPRGTADKPYVQVVKEITVPDSGLNLDKIAMWLYGDINNDGAVNTVDAVQAIKNFSNPTLAGDAFAAGNVNGDNTVNTMDAVQIINRFSNKATETSVFKDMK